MPIQPGDSVWVRSDLKYGEEFFYMHNGERVTWDATTTHCNYAGMKVTVKTVHSKLNDFFQICEDSCHAWFHVGMLENEGLPAADIDMTQLMDLIGG